MLKDPENIPEELVNRTDIQPREKLNVQFQMGYAPEITRAEGGWLITDDAKVLIEGENLHHREMLEAFSNGFYAGRSGRKITANDKKGAYTWSECCNYFLIGKVFGQWYYRNAPEDTKRCFRPPQEEE